MTGKWAVAQIQGQSWAWPDRGGSPLPKLLKVITQPVAMLIIQVHVTVQTVSPCVKTRVANIKSFQILIWGVTERVSGWCFILSSTSRGQSFAPLWNLRRNPINGIHNTDCWCFGTVDGLFKENQPFLSGWRGFKHQLRLSDLGRHLKTQLRSCDSLWKLLSPTDLGNLAHRA